MFWKQQSPRVDGSTYQYIYRLVFLGDVVCMYVRMYACTHVCIRQLPLNNCALLSFSDPAHIHLDHLALLQHACNLLASSTSLFDGLFVFASQIHRRCAILVSLPPSTSLALVSASVRQTCLEELHRLMLGYSHKRRQGRRKP